LRGRWSRLNNNFVPKKEQGGSGRGMDFPYIAKLRQFGSALIFFIFASHSSLPNEVVKCK